MPRWRDGLTAQAILQKFRVEVVCTTDDPTDDLRPSSGDREVESADASFSRLSSRQGAGGRRRRNSCRGSSGSRKPRTSRCATWTDFLQALRAAARLFSFHGLPPLRPRTGSLLCDAMFGTRGRGDFLESARRQSITEDERTQFASFMMLFFGRLDAEKGWTKQLHLGALRNVNTAARRKLGADAGFDTIGRFSAGRTARRIPRPARPGERPAADDPLQRESGRHISVRHADWLLSGRRDAGENSVRQRLVVSRPEGRHHGAN